MLGKSLDIILQVFGEKSLNYLQTYNFIMGNMKSRISIVKNKCHSYCMVYYNGVLGLPQDRKFVLLGIICSHCQSITKISPE